MHNLPYVDLSADTPTRWNSTFDLVRKALKYKVVLTELYNTEHNYPGGEHIE